MQKGLRFFVQICLISGLGFSFNIFSLPSVESRTGNPVTRSQVNHGHSQDNHGHSQAEMMTFTESNQSIENNFVSNEMSREERTATMTLKQIETLKKEVADLRGVIELQDNEIKLLKKSQQDLYLDLDRRLNQTQAATASMSRSAADSARSIPAQSSTKSATPVSSQASLKPATTTTKAALTATQTKTINSSAQDIIPKQATITPIKVQTPSKTTITATNPNPETKNEFNKPITRNSENEALLYQNGYNMVKNKRYEEAIQSFNEYLDAFPDGEHAANAHYWLGEMQMVKWQENKTDKALLENANKAFSEIKQKFPNHTKTADAVLKMGIIEMEKNNSEKAKEYFNQVKSRYPGTTAARIAETRLQETP